MDDKILKWIFKNGIQGSGHRPVTGSVKTVMSLQVPHNYGNLTSRVIISFSRQILHNEFVHFYNSDLQEHYLCLLKCHLLDSCCLLHNLQK